MQITKQINLQDSADHIRHVSVLGVQGVGKTTLIQALAYSQTDNTKIQSQQHKTNKIKLKNFPLTAIRHYNRQSRHQVLINFLQASSPSGTNCEAISMLRVTDGAIIVAEPTKGFLNSTKDIIQYSIKEKNIPILMINKIDTLLFDQKIDLETIYKQIKNTINIVNNNAMLFSIQQQKNPNQISPYLCNVIFGSVKDKWGFTLQQFANTYSATTGIKVQKLLQILWGDHYFDKSSKKWYTQDINSQGTPLQRGFNQYILKPMIKLCRTVRTEQFSAYTQKIVNSFGIKLNENEKMQKGNQMLNTILRKWLPLKQNTLQSIIKLIPSPKYGQKHRLSNLYTGPMNDPTGTAIIQCNPKGPLIFFITRLFSCATDAKFYAIGRVFSGELKANRRVKIMGSQHRIGTREDIYEKFIDSIHMSNNRELYSVQQVSCGNIVVISGIGQYIQNTATIRNVEEQQILPLRNIYTKKEQVISTCLSPCKAQDLPKLVESAKGLIKINPQADFTFEDTGEFLLKGYTQSHLKSLLHQLEQDKTHGEFDVEIPRFSYRETITESYTDLCLVKSQNKHNRLYGKVDPLGQQLCDLIQTGKFTRLDSKATSAKLCQQFKWDKREASKIWSFGPQNDGANILVDTSIGVCYINQIKQAAVSAFRWASKEGVLCSEPMRGIRFNLCDVELRTDAIHRGGGQIIPAARRLYYALQLLGQPTLCQPIYRFEVQVLTNQLPIFYKFLTSKRGQILEQLNNYDKSLANIIAYLPVSESLNLSQDLQNAFHSKIQTNIKFAYWKQFQKGPFESAKIGDLVLSLRKQKGMLEQLPSILNYMDRL